MSKATETSPMISVIIPTRDRAEDLAQSLPPVLAIDYPDFEVIVVDQSTSDASERVLASLVSTLRENGSPWELVITDESASEGGERSPASGPSATHCLIYRRTATVGVSRNLNEGIRCARANVMAFTPDDSTVPPDWLRRAVAVLEDEPQAGIIFGAVAAEQHDWRRTFVPSFSPLRYRRLQGRIAPVRLQGVMGANMVIRRAVFERVGGFDECLGTGCRFRSAEDLDLAYRALRAGFAVVLDPVSSIVHWGGRDYTDGSGQQLIRNTRYGVGAYLVKHLRCGDPLAALALAAEAFKGVSHSLSNVIRHRRLTGAGHVVYLMLGTLVGFRQPLDRRRRLYLPTGDDRP